MRTVVLLALAAACSKSASEQPAQIIDLSTSLAELQRDFDAHAGEIRFVTLLSPS